MNQILTVNEVKQKIDIKFWFLHEWFDPRLVWNPVMYEGIVCDQIYQKIDELAHRSKTKPSVKISHSPIGLTNP